MAEALLATMQAQSAADSDSDHGNLSLNDSGIGPAYPSSPSNDDATSVRTRSPSPPAAPCRARKFRKRSTFGPMTRADEEKAAAKSLYARQKRRRSTHFAQVASLQDPAICDYDVFSLVVNRKTKEGWYAGSRSLTANFESTLPICQFAGSKYSNASLTNDFGIHNVPLDEGEVVQESPQKNLREIQITTLQNLPLLQGVSPNVDGHGPSTSAFSTNKTT